MNNELFRQARVAYLGKNYKEALNLYTRCLQDAGSLLAPGETGQLYHQIGNCLAKLHNPNEAIHAYVQAAADGAYDACGAVNYNLGMAYVSLHDYEDAVKHFKIAVSDTRYDTPYKAYAGMGSALLKLGKSAEAGVAFRESALDERNPDPTKSLLNLGICFMVLNRPSDAVLSYESALQFDMGSQTRNKLYANLGQAYVACGQMQKAATAFEEAIADKTYFLSDSASVDYQRAIAAVAQGTSEITRVMAPVSSGADMSGLDVAADSMTMYADSDTHANGQQDSERYCADPYTRMGAYNAAEGSDRFFTASDEELEQWSKGLAKQDRKRRNVGLKILVTVIFLILIALGAAVFLYTQGWGYPTQETVIRQLFTDPQNVSADVFSDEVSGEAAASMLDPVVRDNSPVIDGINKSMSNSVAYVTAKTPEGGSVQYKVVLVRDLIGWKVSSVELYFPSQN